MASIDNYIKERAQDVEASLKRYFSFSETPATRLLEAIKYSLLDSGKRIRPVLSLAVTEVLGGYLNQVMPVACAIEMIHTYSLMHDDLPAMDDDDLRRGKPTSHKKYDEATAILAGDTLQAYAYEILARESDLAGVDPRIILKWVKELSRASGLDGMAGGQMLDLQSENKKITQSELQKLHSLKTGALLRFAVTAPMYLVEVDKKTRNALDLYANSVGLAFQIKDDILDVEGTTEQLGKTAGKDDVQSKSTYVSLLGMAKAKEYLETETKKAYTAVKIFGKDNILLGLAQYLIERKN